MFSLSLIFLALSPTPNFLMRDFAGVQFGQTAPMSIRDAMPLQHIPPQAGLGKCKLS